MDMKVLSAGEPPLQKVDDEADRTVAWRPPVYTAPELPPEVNYRNWYAAKKTVSEGLFDVALLSANAAQLKHVLQLGPRFEFYGPVLVLVSLSIALQVIAMGLLAVIGFLDLSKECHQRRAETLTNVATAMATLVAMINIVAASFNLHGHEDFAVLKQQPQ